MSPYIELPDALQRRPWAVRRAGLAFLLALALGSVVVLQPAEAENEADRSTSRLAGATRVETAVAVSGHAFPDGARTVYLARADEPADALAAGALTDGPVLLVPSCGEVPPVVLQEIDRLEVTNVVALGGQAAVCDEVLRQASGSEGAPPPPPGHKPQPDEPVNEPRPRDYDVQIRHVEADPPGDDVQPEHGEYVELWNSGDEAVDVSYWFFLDADDNYMSIGEGYTIPPGGSLLVYPGPGTNTEDRYYVNRTEMLDDDGDTIRLFRANGDLIDTYSY